MVKISRDKLKAGDHIYTWRTGYIYAHHGIYVGEDTVIHFTSPTGTSSSKFFISSSAPKCRNQSDLYSKGKSVVSSCLDCFLAGGKLYLYEYNVYWALFCHRTRGTCTTAESDSPEQVVHRANYLLEHNGFGDYNLVKNNCEDFAIYCKTSLLVNKRYVLGGSGQVSHAVGFMLGFGTFAIRSAVRLITDIGRRKDVDKISVENLVLRMKSQMNCEM